MRPVKIFTDSTADLSIELRKQYNISLIPLYVQPPKCCLLTRGIPIICSVDILGISSH
jgi:hypothetical protein